MQHKASLTAHVEVQRQGSPAQFMPLRRLRQCVELHVSLADGAARSSVSSVPPVVQGTHYAQSEDIQPGVASSKHVSLKTLLPATAYVLWPALQEPPIWLLEMFELVRGAELGVRWSLNFKQRAYLNLTSLRKAYQDQVMLVWRLRERLKPGAELNLPPALPPADQPSAIPWFDYILCVRCSGHAQASMAAVLADRLACSASVNPATCPMQHIYAGLEEGTFDPTTLAPTGAADLLQRVMLAADYELLTMLIEAGIGDRCTQPCLQLLLQYAELEGLPELARLVVQQTSVELTSQALFWLIQELLEHGTPQDLEQLLVGYCLDRRNPLSSTAAIERSLVKAADFVSRQHQEAALLLSQKFNAAKHALLQQLIRWSAQHHADGNAPADLTGNQPLLQPQHHGQRALQGLLQSCFEEKSGKAIGWGSHGSSGSIHDASPYSAAVRLDDAKFLSLPAVVEYTDRLWYGTELEVMLDLLLPDGDTGRLKPGARRLRGAAIQAKAAVAFKQQVVADQQQPDLLSGPDLAACSGLYSSTGVACKGPGLKQSALLDDLEDGNCYIAVPEATLLPGAVGSLTGHSRPDQSPQLRLVSFAPRSDGTAAPILSGTNDSGKSRNRSDSQHSIELCPSSVSSDSKAATACSSIAASHNIRWLEPTVGLELLRNLGLARDGNQPLAYLASRNMHATLLAPRAVHGSARGRWTKRCLFELLFLVWYQVSIMGLLPETLVLCVLPVIVFGNLVDVVFQLHYKFRNRVGVYLSDHFVKLNIVVNLGLLVIITLAPTQMVTSHTSVSSAHMLEGNDGQQLRAITAAASAFAVFVWVRGLGIIIPASARLGAMLVTVRRAAEEAAVMIPLILVLMAGFATSLTVVYQHAEPPEYHTLAGAMRMLVGATGGDLDLLWFERAAEGDRFMAVWGQCLLTCYVVIVNILIMTLLIAVINFSYHPATIKEETVVMHAQTVQHYDWQHTHGIAGSPANILQLLLLWLPHGYRQRTEPMACLKYCIPPLDGYVPADAVAAPQLLIATGPAEVGYLAFLLTTYPLTSVVGLIALLLHTPVAVVHFALKGHTMWLDSSWGESAVDEPAAVQDISSAPQQQPGQTLLRLDSRKAHMPMATHPGLDSGSPTHEAAPQHKAGAHARRKSIMLVRRASLVLGPNVQYMSAGAASIARGESPGLVPVHHTAAARRLMRNMSNRLQIAWIVVSAPAIAGIQIVLAAFVGLVVHLLLVAALAAVVVWAWFTRVLFCLYCIFVPAAANLSCCIQCSRKADFWSRAAVQAAFAAADRLATSSHTASYSEADVRPHYSGTASSGVQQTVVAGVAGSTQQTAPIHRDKVVFDGVEQLCPEGPAGDVQGTNQHNMTDSISYYIAPPPGLAADPACATAAVVQANFAGRAVGAPAKQQTTMHTDSQAASGLGDFEQSQAVSRLGDFEQMNQMLTALSQGMSNEEVGML